MTPTTWQGRYTLPAAPVTFALHSARIIADAGEPSRLYRTRRGLYRHARRQREPPPPGRSGPPCLV